MTADQIPQRGPAFRRFTRIVVFAAILLVWWGAATTTKQAGMVFADWPLSLGSYNPPGWLEHVVPFLEHSHRLLAQVVGVLVLVQFAWVYVRGWKSGLELAALVVLMGVVLGFYIAAGSERFDAGQKRSLFTIAAILSVMPVAWLAWSWRGRDWDLMQKLCALALLMVTTQAILGGLRVTEISNLFAVVHGCFAQAFFCVLILITLLASPRWNGIGFTGDHRFLRRCRLASLFLVGIVILQLCFGASMRHFHRHALPDTDLILTQGRWIPSFDDPMIVMLFLHKFTALALFCFVAGMFLSLGRTAGCVGRHVLILFVLILIQVALGLTVIGTGKSFWVTNVHVLNGLLILAVSFVFAVRAINGIRLCGGLAKEGRFA